MLEWIWLHMAINAAVISTAAYFGDTRDPSAAASGFMKSRKALQEAIRCIRETIRIVEARGVDLRGFKGELGAYRLPAAISSLAMKGMFAGNELTRKIMELHNNKSDLLYVCECVYSEGKRKGCDAPLFYERFERMRDHLGGTA
jgi:2-dehydropantoate 2-reductase